MSDYIEIFADEPSAVEVLTGIHGLTKAQVLELIEGYGAIGLTKEDIMEMVQDYEGLLNLPKINGIEIKGDKRLIDYGYDTVSNIELEDLLK